MIWKLKLALELARKKGNKNIYVSVKVSIDSPTNMSVQEVYFLMHLRGNIKNIMSQDEDHYQNKGYYKITKNQFCISPSAARTLMVRPFQYKPNPSFSKILTMEPPHKMLLNSLQYIVDNRKGFSTVFGVFLMHLCAGCYHGTFGNLLPYFTSYLRLVM